MNAGIGQKEAILDRLKNLLLRLLPEPGIYEPPIPSLQLVRRDSGGHSHRCLERPIASVFVQGNKNIILGAREFSMVPGDCLVVGVDMPSSSMITGATPAEPFLSIVFDLNRKILADLLMQMPGLRESGCADARGVAVISANTQLLDAVWRLTSLLEKPEQIPVLGQLFLRELHYYLLASGQSNFLRDLYMQGAKNSQIMEALTWLKGNLAQPVRIEELARQAHMSVSSLHRHFKGLTGLSPLQYHKQLRLYEAQRLMLAENERAATAALAVGYESVTQFNREYKRLFGQPPHRDINRRRGGQS